MPAGSIEERRAKKEPPKMGSSFGKEEGVISESISQADLYGVAISGVYLL